MKYDIWCVPLISLRLPLKFLCDPHQSSISFQLANHHTSESLKRES